jgi:hypothetical protein
LIGLPFFDSPKNFSSRLCSLVILMFFGPHQSSSVRVT